jgi:formylglycine-generating enzyme required for sulfatase activity
MEGKGPVYTVSSVSNWLELKYTTDIPSTTDAKWDAVTCDFTADGYRLPTEWEWEYAARGGTNVREWEYSGSVTIGDVAWYWDNSYVDNKYSTRPVGTLGANDLGLFDMSGNVCEWCWNKGDATFDGSSSGTPFSTPTGDAVVSTGYSSNYRVIRGGSWEYDADYCLVSYRNSSYPYNRYGRYGFRVVCR